MNNLYKSIKKFVFGLYGKNLKGHALSRAKTLVNILYGIIKSKKSSLSEIASELGGRKKFASKVKQIKRWIMSKHNNQTVHFVPFVIVLLECLSERGELVFIIDGSTVGNGCIALMISVVYEGRSLPICWVVRKGKKGHFPEQMHVDLVKVLKELVPAQANVVLLGDGEFDGCDLQKACAGFGWQYVFRATKDVLIYDGQEKFQLKNMSLGQLPFMLFDGVEYSAKRYGEVNVGYFHEQPYKDPLFLVSNMELISAYFYYKKRYLIEMFFSDIKSRGFYAQKSKLEDPQRVATLLIALCLAYIFTIQQAIQAVKQNLIPQLTYDSKNEASLFTIGKRMLKFCENNCIKIKFSISNFLHSQFCVPL